MGKTIMLSSLIQSNRGNPNEAEDDPMDGRCPSKVKQLKLDKAFKPTQKAISAASKSRATLIVAPASLLDQWSSELQRSSQRGTVNVIVWHGQGRNDLQSLIDADDAIDVVITSYGTLASEHAKTERGGMSSSPIYESMFRLQSEEVKTCRTCCCS
jgi:DNA repair protein RAD5